MEAARAVLEYRSFDEAAKKIFRLCKQATGATAGYVALLSDDGSENEVRFLDSGGLPCSVDPTLPMPIRGLRAEAYRTNYPVYDNEFSKSKWMQFMPSGHVVMQNVMFAPMVLDGKVIGLLGLGNKPTGFSPSDAEWASIFAEIASVALHNAHLVENLEKSEKRYEEAYNQAKFYQNLMAHDINNIFQVILSAVEISTRILKESKESSQINEMLTLIMKQFEHGVRIISNVQKLSQLEDNEITTERIEIDNHLEKAVEYVRDSFKPKEVLVNIIREEGKYYTNANLILYYVFENILHNAVKYNNNINVEVVIKISRTLADSAKFIKIEFQDNGIGIPDEKKKSIFYRSPEYSLKGKGMGIGLSLVEAAVKSFGGKIQVEDRVRGDHSQGSNFIIFLPDADSE